MSGPVDIEELRDQSRAFIGISGRVLMRAAADEIESLRVRLGGALKRADEGFAAHAASFGALQAISMLTDLAGEVDDYTDVVRAVERLTAPSPDRANGAEPSAATATPSKNSGGLP